MKKVKTLLNSILFLDTVVLLLFCNRQPLEQANRLLFVNYTGVVSSTGDTLRNSPLLLLAKNDSVDSSAWYTVLLPNRITSCVKLDTSLLRCMVVENDSLEAFLVSPDDELFSGSEESTAVLHQPILITGAAHTRRSLHFEEMRLWDKEKYYPMLQVRSGGASGYVPADCFRVRDSFHSSDSNNISENTGYFGQILPPFINGAIDSAVAHRAASVSASYVFNGSTISEDEHPDTFRTTNCMIHHPAGDNAHLQTIYSINDNSVLLLCYGKEITVRIRFDEEDKFQIKDYKTADLDGNGFYEFVLELGYLYGDGVYNDLLIIQDLFVRDSFQIRKYNFDGISGEGEQSEPENGLRTWDIRKDGNKDQIVIISPASDGTTIEKKVVPPPINARNLITDK